MKKLKILLIALVGTLAVSTSAMAVTPVLKPPKIEIPKVEVPKIEIKFEPGAFEWVKDLHIDWSKYHVGTR